MKPTNEPAQSKEDKSAITVQRTPDQTESEAFSRLLLKPGMRHAVGAAAYADPLFDQSVERPSSKDNVLTVDEMMAAAQGGDLRIVSDMLVAQAVTLDTMFTELARRAGSNMGQYLDAADRYARLALKAQSNCRATLEALTKLHQPREPAVRQVNVNEGGQAVIADQFHHHSEIGTAKLDPQTPDGALVSNVDRKRAERNR